MTINELIESGVILQGLGRVYVLHEGSSEETLFEAGPVPPALYAPVWEKWAAREVAYLFPTLDDRGAPTIWAEVR